MSAPINPTLGTAFIQLNGAGNRWQALPPETTISAPSGGGASYESDFVRRRYKGTRQTSNPERFTFTISSRRTAISKLRDFAKSPCLSNVMVLYGCEPQTLNNFDFAELWVDCGYTSLGASDMILNLMDQNDPKLKDDVDTSAAIRIELRKIAAEGISGTVSASAAINKVISIGYPRCAGACGTETNGEDEFLAVTDGRSPATIPYVLYTNNNGVSWTAVQIAAVANGVAVDITVAGAYVLVACTGTNAGLYRAPLADIRAGAATFTAVTGVPAATAVNAVLALTREHVVAVGQSGNMWLSRDGGFNFSAVTTGTANHLTHLAGQNENLIFAGGANGTLVRFRNLNAISVLPSYAGIGTDAITALAIPQDRFGELYVGTTTGEIHRTRNSMETSPTWEELQFDKPTGGGIIEDIAFADAMGASFWVVQSNASQQSRVILDYSGGNMSSSAINIGGFTSPTNAIMNSIAPTSFNNALMVGEVVSSNGFIGRISG